MNKFRIWSLAAAVPLMASCGLLDSIESQINDAVGSLTAVTQGNLTELVSGNAETMEQAGAQLKQLKAGAAKPSAENAPEGFSLGGAPGLRGAQAGENNVFDQINDLAECVVITRANDPEAGVRKLTADYNECTDQGGTITSELTESGGLDLNIAFDGYLEEGKTTNGTIDWTIDLTLSDSFGESSVIITANQQLTISDSTLAAVTKLSPSQDEVVDAVVADIVASGTVVYTIDPGAGQLKIAGTSNYTQGTGSASVNFANIVFDFDVDGEGEDTGCNEGPAEGSISMTGDGQTLTITIVECGNATSTDPDGNVTTMSNADVNAIFEDTLKALVGMFENVNKVVQQEFQGQNACTDTFQDDGSEGESGNDSKANAATLTFNSQEGGIQIGQLALANEDWYKVSLGAGTYVVTAVPKSCYDLWPFICVTDSDGNELGQGCDINSGLGVGFFEFTVDAQREVLIRMYDPFEDYQCQTYTIDLFNVETAWEIFQPSCEAPTDGGTGGPGGDSCPVEWIGDNLCDQPCIPLWSDLGVDPTGDDGGDCSEANFGGECPLSWIGNGFCDQPCVDNVWASTDQNPFSGVAAGTDDGGDCDFASFCPAGQAVCHIYGAPADGQCVSIETFEIEGCGSSFCPNNPPHQAQYDPNYNDIFCFPVGP